MRHNTPEKQAVSPRRRVPGKTLCALNGLPPIPRNFIRGVAPVDLDHVPDYLLSTRGARRPERPEAERQMAQFDDREKAQEAKFARDGELRFKAEARRNKLLGLWAAEHMGLSDEHAKAYAGEVVASDFEEAGDEDVFRKVSGDLKAKGASVSDDMIRKKMAELTILAREQILTEG
jgi:hypothetical protein